MKSMVGSPGPSLGKTGRGLGKKLSLKPGTILPDLPEPRRPADLSQGRFTTADNAQPTAACPFLLRS